MLWLHLGKQKEPITQSIRNRREHSSRFKVMFYVIGSENSKSGSAFYSSRQQNQRRGGAVRRFSKHRIRVGQTRHFSIWSNSLFSCYVCADIFSTALLYKMRRFPVNAVNVNFMRRGSSTFCCYPLIAVQRRRANLSTAGEARSSRPLTWAVGSATRCRIVLLSYSEFQKANFNGVKKVLFTC